MTVSRTGELPASTSAMEMPLLSAVGAPSVGIARVAGTAIVGASLPAVIVSVVGHLPQRLSRASAATQGGLVLVYGGLLPSGTTTADIVGIDPDSI